MGALAPKRRELEGDNALQLHGRGRRRKSFHAGALDLRCGGNLYGGTNNGGKYGYGTVFELSPSADGTWTETLLHTFDGKDGIAPSGGLIFDAAGNLYGETFGPGNYMGGGGGGETGGQLVYELTPNLDGTWSETVLHRFDNPASSGPSMGLIFDAVGNSTAQPRLAALITTGRCLRLLRRGSAVATLRNPIRTSAIFSGVSILIF